MSTEVSCKKSCSSLDDLILHFGAIPHEKVLSLVLSDSYNPEERLSLEPEVILVDECDSMDDIKRENEVMKKEKEALVKQLEELKKENEEVKTKVAQYQKGAIVWNGTLARSKAD